MSRLQTAVATLVVVGSVLLICGRFGAEVAAPDRGAGADVSAAGSEAVVQPTPARGQVGSSGSKPTATEDHSRDLLLPDGTYVAALNNAVGAAPLREYWGARPWSPIVAVECNDAGIEWYCHENGSYSTTEMVMRSDLGRMAALTRVAHVGQAPAAPASK